MAVLKVHDINRKEVGQIEASDHIFNCEVNTNLFYEVVKMQLANRRAGTASCKTRHDVARTGAKLFRQKGTGRARRGDRGTPLMKGGGVAHGPHPRDYSYRVSRKVRSGALCSAISLRNQEGKLVVVDSLAFEEYKTKAVAGMLSRFELAKPLFIEMKENDKFYRSARNIEGVDILPVAGLNVYDILNHKELVLTRESVERIEERLK